MQRMLRISTISNGVVTGRAAAWAIRGEVRIFFAIQKLLIVLEMKSKCIAIDFLCLLRWVDRGGMGRWRTCWHFVMEA